MGFCLRQYRQCAKRLRARCGNRPFPCRESADSSRVETRPDPCRAPSVREDLECSPRSITSPSSARTTRSSRKFYEAVFGMTTSAKTRPARAVTVGDGYVGLNINPRRAGRSAGLDHFGIQVEDTETAFDRMRKNYPTVKWLQAPVDAAVRRHHHARSRRQHVRHLAEGHGEPHVGLCRERRQGQSAPHQSRGAAHDEPRQRWPSSIATCSSSRRRTSRSAPTTEPLPDRRAHDAGDHAVGHHRL